MRIELSEVNKVRVAALSRITKAFSEKIWLIDYYHELQVLDILLVKFWVCHPCTSLLIDLGKFVTKSLYLYHYH